MRRLHFYDANDKQVILQDNSKWPYTSQTKPDPECPTCSDNNINTLNWKLFQKGFNSYIPLLKAAEISLEVSAALLSGSIGFEGLFVAKTGSRVFFTGAGTEASAINQGLTLGQTRAGQNLMKQSI